MNAVPDNLAEQAAALTTPQGRLQHGFYRIVNKHGRAVPFQPNEAQADYIATATRRDVIPKARQRGITTLLCLISLDEALFYPNQTVAIIAHKLDDAQKIFATKVRYPFENLAPEQAAILPKAVSMTSTRLKLSNGSSISVTTSARSGTLTRLHISEFGKICARMPYKAREIVTGSFPAAEHGSITIESTAEGQEGKFYEIVQDALHGTSEWRPHFYAWQGDPENVRDPASVRISDASQDYFKTLEHEHGVELSDAQKAWYVITEQNLGSDMKRENPSYVEEAFEQAIDGAYFAQQVAFAYKHGAIGRFPFDPRYDVSTFWDLGRNDNTSIWLHQRVGERNRFVGFYENSGEHISHYARWLDDWARERDARFARHYWPHDGDRQDLFLENGRLGVASEWGITPDIVARPRVKMDAIEAARAVFPQCDFDEAACAEGIVHLKHYRKAWNESRGVWADHPLKDGHDHGADAFQTFACGYTPPLPLARRGNRTLARKIGMVA